MKLRFEDHEQAKKREFKKNPELKKAYEALAPKFEKIKNRIRKQLKAKSK